MKKLWVETNIVFDTDLTITEDLIPFVRTAIIVENPIDGESYHTTVYGTVNSSQSEDIGEDVIAKDCYYYYGDNTLLFVRPAGVGSRFTVSQSNSRWRYKHNIFYIPNSTYYVCWYPATINWEIKYVSGNDGKYHLRMPYDSVDGYLNPPYPYPLQIFYHRPTAAELLPNSPGPFPWWTAPEGSTLGTAIYSNITVKRNIGVSYADICAINPSITPPPDPSIIDNTKYTLRWPNLEETVDWRIKGKNITYPWKKIWVKIEGNKYRLRIIGDYMKWVDYTMEEQEYIESVKSYKATYRRNEGNYQAIHDSWYYTYDAGNSYETTKTRVGNVANITPDNLRLMVSFLNENKANETRIYLPRH